MANELRERERRLAPGGTLSNGFGDGEDGDRCVLISMMWEFGRSGNREGTVGISIGNEAWSGRAKSIAP